ncbi:MAG: type IV pilus modification protein PilV [Rhodanobacter sp.]|nr:MAG: type IV pilus modification protein PilV [Rhodanobacter sp.]TAM13640.1 MAG: type IV pilus modification protein PilV [Rhodanobacter sp.]TAM35606.1 MAG: type IV pilus modification protein PilV [Rhodanobacter sp.]
MAAQRGAGMIEVLVAVLVLSIGFVGIAALQARSLSTNNSAMARSMATVDSYSILDAMRADLANEVANASYDGTVTGDACPAAGTSLVTAQLNQWCTQLAAGLGATKTTTGTVKCTPTTDKTTAYCTVSITFDDSRAGVGGSANQTVTTQAML